MSLLKLEGIDNIIFDLGMVIINLETDQTTKAFQNLFGGSFEEVMNQLNSSGHFEDYETGKISTTAFINGIAMHTKDPIQSQIRQAWNAMLKQIPDQRFEILKRAHSNFRTFCLSNTNELHIEYIYDYLQKEKKIKDLNPFFEKVYLSHEIGMRKPNPEIFEYVIQQNSLDPNRTLFIDDTAIHLEGAKKCGLKTFHLEEGIILEDLFPI